MFGCEKNGLSTTREKDNMFKKLFGLIKKPIIAIDGIRENVENKVASGLKAIRTTNPNLQPPR